VNPPYFEYQEGIPQSFWAMSSFIPYITTSAGHGRLPQPKRQLSRLLIQLMPASIFFANDLKQ
jgi:hypothetical protein